MTAPSFTQSSSDHMNSPSLTNPEAEIRQGNDCVSAIAETPSSTSSIEERRADQSLNWSVWPSSRGEDALAMWRRLDARLGKRDCASGATWTDCWLRAYGDLVPHEFHFAESNGQLRGICLVTRGVGQKSGPFPIRTRHLGTAGEPMPGGVCVEYNRPLIEPGYEAAFLTELVSRMTEGRDWDQVRFDGVSIEDAQQIQSLLPGIEIRERSSWYFDLAAARSQGEEILSRLGRSTRSNIRRRLKKYGELECTWAENIEQAEEIFRELVELHQARWQSVGEPGAFASERFHGFQSEAALRLFLEGQGVLFRVRHQGETVGCLFLLIDRNRMLDYLSGFASFEEKPSPGLITHYLCMEHALKRGFDAYDFLVGEKRHKENLSTEVTQLCWLTATRPSLKMSLLQAAQSWKRKLSALRKGSHSHTDASDSEILDDSNQQN